MTSYYENDMNTMTTTMTMTNATNTTNTTNMVSPKMNYLGVAKREIKVEHEEQVRDGWVKLSRDGSGNLVQKFGKEYENEYLVNAEKQDEIDKANALLLRHEQYENYDTELYYKNYINSWDPVEISESEESSNDADTEYDEDEDDDEMMDY